MKASEKSPVHQLVRAVLGQGKKRISVPRALDKHLAKSPSVFDLIKLNVRQLQTLGLKPQDAETLLARGRALALYIARLYREQELRGAPTQGIHQVRVPLPTFNELFDPNINGAAPAGSPEHRASTTAYLTALREWVRDSIVPNASGEVIALDKRRPDVDKTLIDEMAINRVQSRPEITSSVLESQIEAKAPPGFTTVHDYLQTLRFHNDLPYHHDWESIHHVVQQVLKGGSLGDIVRRADLKFPYFKNPGARGRRAEVALQLSNGIGPLKQRLLLEAPYFALSPEMAKTPLRRVDPQTRRIDPDPKKSTVNFYPDNFGSLANFKQSLHVLWIFKNATRLDQDGVDCLLARGRFTPKLSPNAPALGNPDLALTGVTAGARYIHMRQEPAIRIADFTDDGLYKLTNLGEDPNPELEYRADLINRKCRLDRMLQLRSFEVDQLLGAALNAEHRSSGDTSLWIRSSTLRCLGLFKELSTGYDCTPEEYAAFLDVLSVFETDGLRSHFDRVYNHTEPFDDPLRIDNRPFAIIPVTQAEQQVVHKICTGLRIHFETYRYLATVIAGAYGLTTHLECSLEILTSFWRLVRLGRMLDLTPIEATALLKTLSEGDGLVAQLAGRPVVGTTGSADGADVLSAIYGLMTCAAWIRDYDLSVLWLVKNVYPVYVPTVWSDAQEKFLWQLRSQTQSVLVQTATLLEEGAPLRDSQEQLIQWPLQLASLVDDYGLVIGTLDETEAQYQTRVDTVAQAIAEAVYKGDDAPKRAVLQTLLRTIVLRLRDEQQVLVDEALAVYLKVDSLLVPQVVAWAEGKAYDFLKEAAAMRPVGSPTTRKALEQPNEFLKMFAEVERRAQLAVGLELSPSMLANLLEGEQYQWFSLTGRYDISIQTVYYLALYRRLISRARQPEENIIDYLRQVNLLDDDLSDDALRLIRDAAADKLATFFGCGIRHVLECAKHISQEQQNNEGPGRPILCTLEHFDLLLRTLELARNGMDAASAFSLGKLNPMDANEAYTESATSALESLARFNATTAPQDTAEVGQSFTSRCVVDNPTLIANVPTEIAEFEIKLSDFFGNALTGVVLEVGTDLGAVLTPNVRTDSEGRAVVQLQAGARFGTAHMHYMVPLHQSVYGPAVVIDCDTATLKVNTQESSVLPKVPVSAGHLQDVEVYVMLMDRYGNPGAHRPVLWSTTVGQIWPSETVTDANGVSRVWISSLEPGSARVSVSSQDETYTFTFNGHIEFKDKPRIHGNPSLIGVAMVGSALEARCLVLGLDGAPVAGEKVMWWTSADDTKFEAISKAAGDCDFSVLDPQPGAITFFAQLGADPVVELQVWVAGIAWIQNFSQAVRFPVAGASRPTMLWVDVREAKDAAARPVVGYPVRWVLTTEPPVQVIVATDAQGRSAYPFTSAVIGEFFVSALLDLHPAEKQVFELKVIPAFQWKVELISIEGEDERRETINLDSPELALFRDSRYRLEIAPMDNTQLKGSQGALGWSSVYPPRALAMRFTPALATPHVFTDEPFKVEIQTGNVRNGRFQLNLRCDRLLEALVIEGTLSKRSG